MGTILYLCKTGLNLHDHGLAPIRSLAEVDDRSPRLVRNQDTRVVHVDDLKPYVGVLGVPDSHVEIPVMTVLVGQVALARARPLISILIYWMVLPGHDQKDFGYGERRLGTTILCLSGPKALRTLSHLWITWG